MSYDVYQYIKRMPYGTDFTQAAFEKALMLIKEAVNDERADEMTYDYLINAAPTKEEKDIITSIRDDERVHRSLYREIYKTFTGQELRVTDGEEFKKPSSYIEGIKKAVFGELAAMEKYRIIREGLPSRYYRDVVFRILTDEMKHATKYNYILNLHAMSDEEKTMPSIAVMADESEFEMTNIPPIGQNEPRRMEYTLEEAMEIARSLGINFNMVKFTPEEFRLGLNTMLMHQHKYSPDRYFDPIMMAMTVLNRLNEIPDYYTRLRRMEEEAIRYWQR